MIDLKLGDCLEVMKGVESGSIDAIITDPPYGTTDCKWDSVIDFELMWEQLNRVIKKNGAIVLFGSEPFSSALRMSNIKNYKYDWIWNKKRPTGMALVKKQPMRQYENIIIFYNSQCIYNRQFTKKPIEFQRPNKRKTIRKSPYKESETTIIKPVFSNEWDDTKKNPVNILEYGNPNYKKQHPTQKPVALMEYLIKTYTDKGETVLDFTMGSGTTMIACHNTNRNGIGIENDQSYFDIATNRLSNHRKQLTIF